MDMNGPFEGHCPLCNAVSTYKLVDHKNVKRYDCAKCGTFQISLAAEQMLINGVSLRSKELSGFSASLNEEQALNIKTDFAHGKKTLEYYVVERKHLLG